MPVTAKFSQHFYDRLGHEVADELVEWFNQVDAAYRTEFRDLFATSAEALDLRLDRFRADVDIRSMELQTGLEGLEARLNARIDNVAGELNARIDKVAGELHGRIDRVAGDLAGKIDRHAASTDVKLEAIQKSMAAFEARLVRWMFLMWIGTLGTVIAFLTFAA